MKRIIAFSGGLDSTTCLLKAIEKSKDTDEIVLYYFDLQNNAEKAWVEKNAIRNILSELKSKNLLKESVNIDIQNIGMYDYVPDKAIPKQAFLWISRMLYLVHNHVDLGIPFEVWIGYVRGDRSMKIQHAIQNYWNISADALFDDSYAPLVFPVINYTKKQEIAYIKKFEKKHNTQILNKIWSCELPIIKHTSEFSGYAKCNDCEPCKRMTKVLKNEMA